MILGFRFARIFWDLSLQGKFWDLSLKKVLRLNRGVNAGKTLSQTSHSYQLEVLGNLEAFLKILKTPHFTKTVINQNLAKTRPLSA